MCDERERHVSTIHIIEILLIRRYITGIIVNKIHKNADIDLSVRLTHPLCHCCTHKQTNAHTHADIHLNVKKTKVTTDSDGIESPAADSFHEDASRRTEVCIPGEMVARPAGDSTWTEQRSCRRQRAKQGLIFIRQRLGLNPERRGRDENVFRFS